MGFAGFARRYSRYRCFFLFLRLLRCFSSPGSLRTPMDSVHGGWGLPSRVSPFRYLRVTGYLLLAAAFRSLSRLSSALSAQASSLCSFLLDLLPSPCGSSAFASFSGKASSVHSVARLVFFLLHGFRSPFLRFLSWLVTFVTWMSFLLFFLLSLFGFQGAP